MNFDQAKMKAEEFNFNSSFRLYPIIQRNFSGMMLLFEPEK